LNLGN